MSCLVEMLFTWQAGYEFIRRLTCSGCFSRCYDLLLMNFSFISLVSSDSDSFVVVILLFSRTSTVITRCTFLSDLLFSRCSKLFASSAEVTPLGKALTHL